MKKIGCFFLIFLLIPFSLAGCRQTDASVSPKIEKAVKISFLSNILGGKNSALENAVIAFEKESGIDVDFSSPGGNYENIMKVNMATGEMPDVFTTHGWSVTRYQKYLLPLNGLSFAKNISETIRPIITDPAGSLLVLPIDIDISGIVYNPEVLQKCGVSANGIFTWDDFTAACRRIKKSGYDPICIAGKDSHSAGQMLDRISSSFFITDANGNQRAALRSGKFDDATWEKVAGLMASWGSMDFFNSDAQACDYIGCVKEAARNRSAFLFCDNTVIFDVEKANPNIRLQMMPIPSAQREDPPTLVVGESIAIGIWKESANPEAAEKLLEYLAQPDIAAKIASSSGKPSALTNAKTVYDVQFSYLKNQGIRTFPYFDREYLPTGMWDVLSSVGMDILSEKPGAVARSAAVMQDNFKDKFYFHRS